VDLPAAVRAGPRNKREAPVNWCPVDQTVLANEQVIDGHCERCGALVESRTLAQWYFSITEYAQRLLDDMALLEDWPERVLSMQRNWIGRSEGAEVLFHQRDLGASIAVFTTRPDTLFGATFFVLAPEHPLIPTLVAGTETETEVMEYVRHHSARPEEERAQDKAKTGVDTAAPSRTLRRTRRFRSGWPTTCSWAMAPARSWQCPRTTNATSSSPEPRPAGRAGRRALRRLRRGRRDFTHAAHARAAGL
jgi:leucyl-tRNA synthetase